VASSGGARPSSRSSPTPRRRSSTTRSSRASPRRRRPGVSFSRSPYGLGRPEAARSSPGWPADVVAFSLAPGHDAPGQGRARRQDWRPTRTRGSCRSRSSRSSCAKGNPKGIHTWDDLLRPGIKVPAPTRSRRAAAKWNIMAAYGAKSDGGSPAGRPGLPARAHHQARQGPGQVRREALQDFASGTATSSSPTRTRRSRPGEGPAGRLRRARQTILIENPIAVVAKSTHPRRPGRSSTTRCRRRPSRSSPTGATGRSTRRCSPRTPQVPGRPAACSRSGPRRLEQGQRRDSSNPAKGSVAKIEAGRGGSTAQVRHSTARAVRRLHLAWAAERPRSGLGVADAVAERQSSSSRWRPLVARSTERRAGHLLVGRLQPSGAVGG